MPHSFDFLQHDRNPTTKPGVEECMFPIEAFSTTQSSRSSSARERKVHEQQFSGTVKPSSIASTGRLLQRSLSEGRAIERSLYEHVNFSSQETGQEQCSEASLLSLQICNCFQVASRPTAQRYNSNPTMHLRSRYHDSTTAASSPRKAQKECTYFSKKHSHSLSEHAPQTMIHVKARSSSSQRSLEVYTDSGNVVHPLKPCIKTKASSNPTSPPAERQEHIVEGELQPLRRVKTVDFDENGSKPSSTLPTMSRNRLTRASDEICKRVQKESSLLPIRSGITKGLPADPAVTCTDVHVIAIASVHPTEHANQDYAVSVTPTIQIIQSRTGCQKIIWEDILPEHGVVSKERRNSSAIEALGTFNAQERPGLERVNTKLKHWNETYNSPSCNFKPTIMVFPDHDVEDHCDTSPNGDEDDLNVLAPPPNSKTASAAHSRNQSSTASAPITRPGSETETLPEMGAQDSRQVSVLIPNLPLDQPSPDRHKTHVCKTRERMPEARKLSNTEDFGLTFRSHRDSVVIAHGRLPRTRRIPPQLSTQPDMVPTTPHPKPEMNHIMFLSKNLNLELPNSTDQVDLLKDKSLLPASGSQMATLTSSSDESMRSDITSISEDSY